MTQSAGMWDKVAVSSGRATATGDAVPSASAAKLHTKPGRSRRGRSRHQRAAIALSAAAAAAGLGVSSHAFANTSDTVNSQSGVVGIDAAGTYSGSVLPTSTNDVVFSGTNTYTNTSFTFNAQNLTVGTLDDFSATALTIGGSKTLSLVGGTNNSGATAASDVLYVASGGKLTFNANVAISQTPAAENFDIAGTAAIGGTITGTGGFTLTGGGVLTLSASNTYTGGIIVSNGTLKVGGAAALGAAASTVNVSSGGVLDLNGTSMTVANALTINGTGSGTGALINSSGTGALYTGSVTLGSASEIGTITGLFGISGGVSGTGALTLNATSTGTITLSGAVNNTGTITNSGGGIGLVTISGSVGSNVTTITENSATSSLTISGTGVIVNASGTTLTNNNASGTSLLTVTGGVSGSGNVTLNNNSAISAGITISGGSLNNTGTLTNSGTGTGQVTISSIIGSNVTGLVDNSNANEILLLTGANTFTRGLTITAGTVRLGNTSALGTVADTVTVSSGGVLDLNGTSVSTANALTLNGSGLGGTGGLINSSTTATGYTGVITLGSAATIGTGTTGGLTLTGGITSTGTANLTLNAVSTGAITINNVNNTGTVTSSGTGTGAVTITTLGTNVTSISEQAAGAFTITNTLSLATLTGNAGTFNSSGAGLWTLTGGITGTGNVTFNANNTGGITLGVANNTGTITNFGSGIGVVTITGVVGTNVTGVVENSANSTLTLTGANTYTGATTITQGVLSTNGVVVSAGASGLGNATSAIILGGATTTGTLSYTGANNTYTRGFTINAGGGEVDVATGITLTDNTFAINNTGPMAFGGAGNFTISTTSTVPFSGTGTLTKNGTGTLTISTNGGIAVTAAAMPININAGTLSIATTNANTTNLLGTGAITLTPGATVTFAFAGATGSTTSNPWTIANAAGTANISMTSGGLANSGNITFATGANTPILKLNNTNGTAATLAFSGNISGTGNIQFNPSGAGSPITLSGASINNTGSIGNVGSSTSTSLISGTIGSNVTSVFQSGANPFTINSALSITTLTGNAGTFTSTGAGLWSLVGAVTGAGNLTLAANSSGGIAVGIVNTTGTINNIGTGSGTSTLTTIGTNVTGLFQNGASPFTISPVVSLTTLSANAGTFTSTGSGLWTFSAGITGNGNVTLAANSTGGITLTGMNNTGSITNIGTGTNTVTLINVGSNVTNIFENSTTSAVVFSGTNLYTGTFTITGGLGVEYLTTSALPGYNSNPAVAFSHLSINNTTLILGYGGSGQFQQADVQNVINGSYPVAWSTTGSSLGLDTTQGNATYAGTLANPPGVTSLGFTKLGSNQLTLLGSSTLSGPTIINNGSLVAGDGVGLSSSSLLIISPTSGVTATFAPIGTLSRALGTSAGNVEITGGTAGFTTPTSAVALSSPAVVNLGGSGDTLTWGSATFNPATLILNDTAGNNTIDFQNAIALGTSTRTVQVNATAAGAIASLSGLLSGTGGLTKTGAGVLTLSNSGNSFSGATTISAGTLNLTGGLGIGSGTAISSAATFTESNTGVIAGTSSVNVTGGTTTLGGTNSYSGGTTATGGTLILAGGGATPGTTGLPAGGTVTLGAATLSVLNDNSGTINYGNNITLNSATMTINVGNNGGGTSGSTVAFGALTAPSAAIASVQLTGSNGYNISFTSLALPGAGGNNTFINPTTTNVTIGSVSNAGTGTTGNYDTLFLNGTSAGNQITGTIADHAGSNITTGNYTRLFLQTANTWTLTGSNTYTGATSIGNSALNTGTLIVNGSLGGTAVSVLGGGTLGGSGSIGDGTSAFQATQGTVTVVGGATTGTQGVINLVDNSIDALTIKGNNNTASAASLTLGGTTAGTLSIIDLEAGNTATDQIKLAGGGAASNKLLLQLGGAQLNVFSMAGTTLAAGTYQLLTYASGTFTGGFTLGGSYAIPVGDVALLSTTGTAEDLIIQAGGATSSNVFWTGAVGSVWSTGTGTTTTNFTQDYAGTIPSDVPVAGTNVFFTASGTTGSLTTTLGSAFTINSLSFVGAAPTSTAAVTIGGLVPLTINAAVGFTDQNSNAYATGVGIVVQSGSFAHTISAPVVLGGSQSWEIDNSTIAAPTNALTVSGPVSGAFAVTKTGQGELILSGSNSFTGGLNVANGTLVLGASNIGTVAGPAGPASATITIGDGSSNSASLLGNAVTIANPISVTSGTGTLTLGSNGVLASTFTGAISGSGNLVISNVSGASTTLTGNSPSFSGNLQVTGTNATGFLSNTILNANAATASNTFSTIGTGTVTVNGANLKIKDNGGGSNQLITVGNGTNGASLAFSGTVGNLDINNNGANTANAFVFNNLNIAANSTMNVTGASQYEVNFTGATTLGAGATINQTTSTTATVVNLLGQVTDGGSGATTTISGAGLTRISNTSSGSANSIAGTLNVTGNLVGYAAGAGNTAGGSNSLGTSTIALSGTGLVHLAATLGSTLTNGVTPGLQDKTFSGITSVVATNVVGGVQSVTTGGPEGLNPTGIQTVANVNVPTANTATNVTHQFTGLLNITTAGMYSFTDLDDDVCTVTIDGDPIIVNLGVTTGTGYMYLSAGLHLFSDRWNNGSGGGAQVLSYNGADSGNVSTVVPAGAFFSANNTADLTSNFSANAITVAALSSPTLDLSSNTTVGAITFGANATLNVTGSNDLTTVTTGAITTNGTSTIAPSSAIMVIPSVTGSAGNSDTLVLGGFSSPAASYSSGNQVTGVIGDGASGTLSLVKSGFSTWILDGSSSNTYSGTTTINGNGTAANTTFAPLVLAKTGGAIAIPGNLTIGNGTGYAAVQLGGNNEIASSAVLTFASSVSNYGYFQMLGFNQTLAGINDATASGVVEDMETQVLSANSTLTLGGSGTYSFNGFIRSRASGTGTGTLNLVMSGAGTQTMTGPQIIYTGITTVNSGQLNLGIVGTSASAFTGTSTATTTITGGTLGLNAPAFNSPVLFPTGSTGTLQIANGTQSLPQGISTADTLNNNVFVQNDAGTSAVLSITQAANATFGGIIRNNAGGNTLGITKLGAGTLTLTNTSTYSGATTVSAGGLTLVAGSGLGYTAMSFANTTTFLAQAGSGTINIGTTGAGTAGATLSLAAGSTFSMVDGSIGTLNVNENTSFASTSLTVGGATLDFELSSAGADGLAVTGGTAAATAAISGVNTVNISTLGSSLTIGSSYAIVAARGIAAGNTFFKFSNGATNELVTAGSNSYSISLVGITGAEELVVANAGNLIWAGQANGNGANDPNWTTATGHGNWSNAGTSVDYTNGSIVTFQDVNPITSSNVPSGAVTIATTGVTPAGVVVNNSAVNYTFSGGGTIGIAGSTGLTKSGIGTLTLAGTNTYTGVTTLSGGILNTISAGIGSGSISFGGGTLQYATGNTTDYSARFATAAGQLYSIDTGGNSVSYAGVLSSAGGTLTKLGAGTLTLGAVSTYTGNTTINGGTLTLTNANGSTGVLSSPTITINAGGTLSLGNSDTIGFTAGRNVLVINDGTLLNNAGGKRDTISNTITMVGGTLAGSSTGDTNSGAFSLGIAAALLATSDASGNPATITTDVSAQVSDIFTVTRGANVSGLSPDLLLTNTSTITPYGGGTTSITIAGNGITAFNGSNSYKGGTVILGGTLLVGNTFALGSTTAGLTMGDTTGNYGTLNLQTFSPTIGGLTVNTSGSNSNTITVTSGHTLTVAGNVTIGPAAPTLTQNSNLVIGGGGALAVTSSGGTFQVGGATGASFGNNATLDLTGLSSVNINLGTTGTVRVNNNTTTNIAGLMSTLLLPTTGTTTITAANLNIGDSGSNNTGAGQINSVSLGGGATTLNVNTVNIGTGSRDYGSLAFAGSNGTIILNAANGTSAAAFNVGTNGANSGTGMGAGVTGDLADFTGHTATLNISTLAVGNQARLSSEAAAFKFDTGTLSATGVQIGFDTTNSNATSAVTLTDTVAIGGGTTTIGTGGVDMGTITDTSTGARSIIGALNITGGTVNIGTTGVFSVRLGNNTAPVETTSNTLSITGGTVNLNGDIVTNSTSRTTTTVTLNGGLLNLTGHNIGASLAGINNVNLLSGTLQNVNQINGGGAVSTTGTGGTLIMAGTNNYTGQTTVAGGMLLVNGTNTGAGAVHVGDSTEANVFQAVLAGTGSITGGILVHNGSTISAGNGITATSTPGVLTTGGQTWSDGSGLTPGGAFNIKFGSAYSSAGNTSGSSMYTTETGAGGSSSFDLLSMSSLTITTMGGTGFNLKLLTNGQVSSSNINPASNYDWVVSNITNSKTYIGDAQGMVGAPNIVLNTANFDGGTLNSSQFTWDFEALAGSPSGSTLHVKYNGAPEPVSFALGLAGAVPLLLSRRRRIAGRRATR